MTKKEKNVMSIRKTVCSFALVALIGCDQGDVEALEAEVGEQELELAADAENLWEGLTHEEMATLEHEDGTDKEGSGARERGVTELAATPDVAQSCIRVQDWESLGIPWTKVTNNCNYSIRIKLVWVFSWDGRCRTLGPGRSHVEHRHLGAFWGGYRHC